MVEKQPVLNEEQKKLLERIDANPEIKKLLMVIFGDYPKIVINEFTSSSQNASNEQKTKLNEIIKYRMGMESYIEDTIVKLSGIMEDTPKEEPDVEEEKVDEVKGEVQSPDEKKKNTKKGSKKKSKS